jgi:hypothetical protein
MNDRVEAPVPTPKTPAESIATLVSLSTPEARKRAFSVLLRALSKKVGR